MDENNNEQSHLYPLDRAYLEAFTSQSGQEVLEDLFWTYFERPMFDPNSNDPINHLAFREGQRSVILDIRAAMRRAQSLNGLDDEATLEDMIT